MNQGFGNNLSSEALEGALPKDQNSPKHLKYKLYAEQINGTAFTKSRHQNLKTWVYRTLPSAAHHTNFQLSKNQWIKPLLNPIAPDPIRLSAQSTETKHLNFINGIFHIASSGIDKHVYWYQCQENMVNEYFTNYDGELLFIPYQGKIKIATEFGNMGCMPGQIIVIPRGITFRVETSEQQALGYLAENSGNPFKLPELGIIGANGLAHPRHFYYPSANFEKKDPPGKQTVKFKAKLWERELEHSPLNVVAWHGNYLPYFYDCKHFNTINTVSYDHLDPSIYTLLTSESNSVGTANLDFVLFPPRLSVAKNTFRLPYFHRNYMSELMGLIRGQYDAKGAEFSPGGVSIHNMMTPHGPDVMNWKKEISSDDTPLDIQDHLAFMLESNEVWNLTVDAYQSDLYQKNYTDCWSGFPSTIP